MEPTLRTINAVISALFFICYTYQFLYIPLVLAKKPKPLTAPAQIFLQLSYYSINLLLITKTTVILSCFAFKIMNINTYTK